MTRLLILSLLMLAATLVEVCPAQVISRNNPYRSFNLTGVNYASMQWESSHRRSTNKSWSANRSGGRFFRGR